MKKILLIALLGIFALSMTSCTQNQKAKNFGGTAEYELPSNKKLVVVTWKDDNMWYLMRDARPGEKAETYQFVEESSWGMLEGTIVLKEHIK